MMRPLLLVLCLLVMLAACAPRQRAALPTETLLQPAAALQRSRNATAAPTLSPAPASVSTMRPLTELPLDGLLFQPGDLPTAVLAEPLDHNPSFPLEDKAPAPDAALAQTFNLEGYPRGYGFVNVWWFDAGASRDVVYQWLTEPPNVEGAVQPPPTIGDRATLTLAQNPWRPGELFFTICRAVVQIRLGRLDNDGQELLTYGQRLAQRLEAVDCGSAAAVSLLPEPLLGPPAPTPPPVLAISTTITATLRSFTFDPTEIGAVAFADANHGWLAVGPRIYATADGGGQWMSLYQMETPVDRMAFQTPLEGWADTRLGRFETRDGGAHWQAAQTEEFANSWQPPTDWCKAGPPFWLPGTPTAWTLCVDAGRNSRVSEKTLFRTDDAGAH